MTPRKTSYFVPSLSCRLIVTFTLLATLVISCHAGKVLNLGDKLPELLEKHPNKSWLVKFYAPWCHHCQQLEPTYNNVAERIYHKHDHLIVGRVDCTKYGTICEEYRIDSYPTIMFISSGNTVVKYRGDRSEDSMIAFAERLSGPSINIVQNCEDLQAAIKKHQLVVLSTHKSNDKMQRIFESLADAHKSSYWFYQLVSNSTKAIKCNKLTMVDERIYLLKRHLDRAIEYPDNNHYANKGSQTETGSKKSDFEKEEEKRLRGNLMDWINKESFPIYGQIDSRNFERVMASGKLLMIAILDEYKPARQFIPTSKEFHSKFEKFAIKLAQKPKYYNQYLFGWSSDLDLIEYITLGSVNPLPNVMILNKDLRYHLVAQPRQESPDNDNESIISRDLVEINLLRALTELERRELTLSGGNTYSQIFLRHTLGYYNKFMTMYKANPLLVSLIFGFPSLIVIFVIYTTCCYDEDDGKSRSLLQSDSERADQDSDDDADLERQQENQRLLTSNGHLKQD